MIKIMTGTAAGVSPSVSRKCGILPAVSSSPIIIAGVVLEVRQPSREVAPHYSAKNYKSSIPGVYSNSLGIKATLLILPMLYFI